MTRWPMVISRARSRPSGIGPGPGGRGSAHGAQAVRGNRAHAVACWARSIRGSGTAASAASRMLSGFTPSAGLVGEHHAVAQDVAGELISILGEGVPPATDERQRARGMHEIDGTAGTHTKAM